MSVSGLILKLSVVVALWGGLMPRAQAVEVWTDPLTIVSVGAYKNAGVAVTFELGALPNCGSYRQAYMKAGHNSGVEGAMDRMYSNLVTAFAAGIPVVILYDNATSNCWIGAVSLGG